MSEWISVKDRLAELNQEVLCINQFGQIRVCYRDLRWKDESPQWFVGSIGEFHPTHWMPLPEPPIEKI